MPEQPRWPGDQLAPIDEIVFGLGFGALAWGILFFAAAAVLDRLREIHDELARIRQRLRYPTPR